MMNKIVSLMPTFLKKIQILEHSAILTIGRTIYQGGGHQRKFKVL